MSAEFNEAVRAIPRAPVRMLPPGPSGAESIAASTLQAIAALLRAVQREPGPPNAFRGVTFLLTGRGVTTKCLTVVIRELQRQNYGVALNGSCDPARGDLADGSLLISWQC